MKNYNDYLINFKDIKYERKSQERVLTGFKDLDYYIKGICTGITEIIGETNVGKSVFTSALINNAIMQDYKVGVFAGEHSLEGYKMLVMQQNCTKGHFELVPFIDKQGNETNICDWYVDEETEQKMNERYNDKLFLYNVEQEERDIDTLLETVKYGYEKFGIRFWVFDNLMEIKNDNQNQWQEQTSIGTKMRNYFVQNKLFGVLVMHTAKGDFLRINPKNAFGSSNITNKGYNILTLYRKDCIFAKKGQEKELEKLKLDVIKAGFDYDKCDGFIDVIKTKGNSNGIVGLIYNPDTKTYSQADKISQTEADKIFKKVARQEKLDLIPIDDSDGDLPF